MKIPIKLDPGAKSPEYKSTGAAGADLCAVSAQVIESGQFVAVSTGVSVSIPEGHYGRIAPRSGLAAKSGIEVLGGVIDSDYRGEIKVILLNTGCLSFRIQPGDRIAQLIIERCYRAEFIEFDSLEETDRGNGGFGSTGV